MVVDWTFRAGDILSFLGFALGGLSVIFAMKSDIKQLALKLLFLTSRVDEQKILINTQSAELARFGELITVMGRFEERFIALQKELDRAKDDISGLRRGEGLIISRPKG